MGSAQCESPRPLRQSEDPRFKKPDSSVATFNVIVANPPYSLKWKPWTSDPRAIGGVAPQSSADWAFVQHMIASMDPKKGRADARSVPVYGPIPLGQPRRGADSRAGYWPWKLRATIP
ncbi:MAG TPA: N-6 DNA methylase [Streptosporangiaceae bacterium]